MRSCIDTNIIIRYIVGDIPEQEKQAAEFFQDAEKGKRVLCIKPIVVGEVSFVLEHFYKIQRDKIAETLESFVSQSWLEVEDRIALVLLWKWYRRGFHFVDSFLIASTEVNDEELLTFDKKMLKEVNTK